LPAETLLDLLAAAGRRPEGGLRFLDREEHATWVPWGEARAAAEAAAGGLQALGVAKGDRVVLVFPTGPDFFAAFFGALLAGAVPVPLYPPVRLGRLAEYYARTARMMERVRARIVLADRRVQRILGVPVGRARPPLGCRTLAELPGARPAPVAVGPGDLALVQFSSGTTVEPKPVALAHRAILAQAEALSELWPDTPTLRHSAVSWLPLYHDMGLIGCVFPALGRDATLTLIPPELFVARPALWLRAISRYRATVSPAPNFAFALCAFRVPESELEGLDLSSWVTALDGAESVAPAVVRAFEARLAPYGLRPGVVTPVYGLSESALAVTFPPLGRPFLARRFDREALARDGRARELGPDEDGAREIVSVGLPLPGFRLEVRGEDGLSLPAGRVGRIWIAGPSLMEGYLDDPQATANAFQGGFLDTGDLGFLWDGELYLTGRAKDVVILRGRNHSPEEIERAVDAVPGARPGCAVAASFLPEGGDGEVLALFVEARRDAAREEVRALPAACRAAVLAATGLDVDLPVVLASGTLPRTSSGKLRRAEAVRLYLADRLEPPAKVTPLRLAGAVARSGLAYARLSLAGRREDEPND
jgi:acyl-CoA synthetase (AMP-forming)/AMP-acid ligase II